MTMMMVIACGDDGVDCVDVVDGGGGGGGGGVSTTYHVGRAA